MEEMEELLRRLKEDRPVAWEEFPDLALYMDQVISYMPRQLIQFQEGEGLTSAMVNNYIKDGLLPRAEGKRYRASHLAYLTAICAMKRVLTVREVKTLLSACDPEGKPDSFYSRFCQALDEALDNTARTVEQPREDEDLAGLALTLALRSYADQLACTRLLDILGQQGQPEQDKPEKAKK